jgi:hypothetical protein
VSIYFWLHIGYGACHCNLSWVLFMLNTYIRFRTISRKCWSTKLQYNKINSTKLNMNRKLCVAKVLDQCKCNSICALSFMAINCSPSVSVDIVATLTPRSRAGSSPLRSSRKDSGIWACLARREIHWGLGWFESWEVVEMFLDFTSRMLPFKSTWLSRSLALNCRMQQGGF